MRTRPPPEPQIDGILYRVVDWGSRFENAGTRKYKKLNWMPISNRFDEIGFRYLTSESNPAELYGAFVAMVMVASRVPMAERDGRLIFEGGRALTAKDLSVQTGFSEELFTRALVVLSKPVIGWLEGVSPTMPVESPIAPEDSGKKRRRRRSALAQGASPPPGTGPDITRDNPTPHKKTGPDNQPAQTSPTQPDPDNRHNGPREGGTTGLRPTRHDPDPDSDQLSPDVYIQSNVLRILGIFRLDSADERQTISALFTRLGKGPQRTEVTAKIVELAARKAAGKARKPIAAWMAEVHKRYPVTKPERARK